MAAHLIIYDLIKEVVASMDVPGIGSVNFAGGRPLEIRQTLIDKDNAIEEAVKNSKYPIVMYFMPTSTIRNATGWYGTAKIPIITIAALSNLTDSVDTRFEEGGTFKSILYPCYYEFLDKLSRHPNVIGGDPDAFSFTERINPGNKPVLSSESDFVDCIDLMNLEIKLITTQTC